MLIVDSGSTKTDYRLILPFDSAQGNFDSAQGQGRKIIQIESKGIHPYLQTEENIYQLLQKTFADHPVSAVEKVFYYGTACSSEENKQKIKSAFSRVFINASIEVEHDLLGAARSACGRNAGLAGILGTGSNCCMYNGENIIEEFSTSGYFLGDEGGGVFMGKKLLKDFIEKRMPGEIKKSFEVRYNLTKHDILHSLSNNDRPNQFLASFSMFIYHHREHAYIHEIINFNFQQYFDVQVKSFSEYKKYPLNLVGSVAYYYQEYIRSIAQDNGIAIGNILEKPIAGLTLYHHHLEE